MALVVKRGARALLQTRRTRKDRSLSQIPKLVSARQLRDPKEEEESEDKVSGKQPRQKVPSKVRHRQYCFLVQAVQAEKEMFALLVTIKVRSLYRTSYVVLPVLMRRHRSHLVRTIVQNSSHPNFSLNILIKIRDLVAWNCFH